MFSRIAVLAVLLLPLAACNKPPAVPAQQIASDFYQAYLLNGAAGGVPDAGQLAKLAPYLSPALHQALQHAAAAEQAYAKAQTEPSPPLIEGDLFSSLFEGATGAEVKACKEDGDKAACQILLAYAPAGQEPAHWQDILYLTLTEDGWRVDDLEYGGDWPFAPKGTLQQVLQDLGKHAGT
ncbi:hypothetical protein HPT27_05905 [Permianibacter sp. IMCC34836]|uniref:hypothetical protein n=1 Tax=Permianibacter fluminis TaxID=2738515 RepID=UPI001551CC04|nr:hypothetical protein [Permianibacter fluminis]NQD36551.1 hypothetical protein [Permianibacter fluminis]